MFAFARVCYLFSFDEVHSRLKSLKLFTSVLPPGLKQSRSGRPMTVMLSSSLLPHPIKKKMGVYFTSIDTATRDSFGSMAIGVIVMSVLITLSNIVSIYIFMRALIGYFKSV